MAGKSNLDEDGLLAALACRRFCCFSGRPAAGDAPNLGFLRADDALSLSKCLFLEPICLHDRLPRKRSLRQGKKMKISFDQTV